jgi:hypothetical protein
MGGYKSRRAVQLGLTMMYFYACWGWEDSKSGLCMKEIRDMVMPK